MAVVVNFPERSPSVDRTQGFVAHRLTEARLAQQMSREELGRKVGLSGQAIGYYEGGDRRPDMDTLLRLAGAVEQPVPFFLHAGEPPPSTIGTRFFRSVGTKTKKLNLALDVATKWLWECVSCITQFVRLPAINLPPVEDTPDEAYSRKQIELIAQRTRRFWGLGDGPIANVVALLETNGIVVTRFEFKTEKIDAFSVWIDRRPYIVLGSDKSSACRSRFDAAHELGHILLHRAVEQGDLEEKRVRDRVEQEAHWFASAFLLPRESLLAEFYSTRSAHIVGLKRRWLVSMAAIVHATKDIGVIDEVQYVLFRKTLAKNGWLRSEPLDDEIPIEKPSLLLKAIRMLREKGVLTAAGFESAKGFTLDFIYRVCGAVLPPTPDPEPRLTLIPT